ncbi:MAG: beta-phosphoglucomutase family hydrolase [Candidatus Margulisiibacteriota bacterium]|nr:beta-phosphoglucomutase family hydrolase [Candidatus Margulisiibacteriota bacterium]
MSIKGAIFDLDGVIVDSVPLHFKAWKKMFAEYGHEFTTEDYLAKVDGRPRLEGAAAILTELSPQEVKLAGDKKQAYFLELLEKGPIDTFDSTIKLIKEMKDQGLKLAMASSSKNAGYILRKVGLFELFDADVSGADLKKGKPDPEIFLKAADKLGLASRECVVFEDARAGVEAARAGGFYCVGIDRHGKLDHDLGADLYVNDLSETSLDRILKLDEKSI